MPHDRSQIAEHLFRNETELVHQLAKQAQLSDQQKKSVAAHATQLVEGVRNNRQKQGSIDAFMQQFSLSSEEGVVLMCLAEALLRIPDAETADKLIADKLGDRDWAEHIGKSDSLFVNASAWAFARQTGNELLEQSTGESGFIHFLRRR